MKKINYFWIAFLFLFGIATGYFGKKYLKYKEKTNPKTHRVGYIFPEKKNVITLDTARVHWHKKLAGVFGGTYPEIYKGSKYQFKERLFASFNTNKLSKSPHRRPTGRHHPHQNHDLLILPGCR